MSAERIDMHQLQELVRLHRLGVGLRAVAREVHLSPMTERRYRQALAAAGLLAGDPHDLPALAVLRAAIDAWRLPRLPREQPSSLQRWADTIAGLVAKGAQPQAIYDHLRTSNPEFRGSRSAVKRLCRRLRKAAGPAATDVAIPVETAPGEVLQVDFGYVGRVYDPATEQARKAWVFVAVLGYSRHLVVRLVFDQRTTTWLRLHAEVFRELGGVPAVVVPDNLKAAVLRAAFGADQGAALNRSYREFARHYGFQIDPTPPRDPRKKGKVESGVKYVRRNFLAPRTFVDIADARAQLARWCTEVAGQRVHGTTGRRPQPTFEAEERAALRPLPTEPYTPVEWHQATVHRDSHVAFDRRLYSVPWKCLGQRVWVRATPHTVTILAADVEVATHDRQGRGPRSTVEAHLPEARSPWRHRSRAYWEGQAAAIGPEVAQFVAAIFDADDVLLQLRAVQGVVQHLAQFPATRACNAAHRAYTFGNYTLGAVKRILREGLDLVPEPAGPPDGGGGGPPGRFARSGAEFAAAAATATVAGGEA